jgi:hypothetical protein
MNEIEISQAIAFLRDKMDGLSIRVTMIEANINQLIDDKKERALFRRQVLLALIGFSIVQIGGLIFALIRLLPK